MVHVLTVGARVRKLLVTFAALERFLSCVKSLVLYQVMFVLESFVTTITGMRSVVYKSLN